MNTEQLAAPEPAARITALRDLVAAKPAPAPAGINVHVHTNYSFACFRSPAEAVWLARQAGVEIFGINDHYTIDGHPEFRQAVEAAKLPAVFSVEIVAVDRAAAEEGALLNDPGNPGRVYLCGKAVTTPGNAEAAATLATLREHQERRNRAMIEVIDQHFQTTAQAAGPSWASVAEQTPLGNTTERHIALASCERIAAIAAERGVDAASVFERVCGQAPQGDHAAQQNQLRSCLLKAGKACYVDEDPAAYPSVEAVRELFLQLGAIPTYPVLGNPLTTGEEQISALCDRLANWGIYAMELISSRNTAERVAEVVAEAEARNWPVFDGTEHNTAAMVPLINELGADARFLPRLREGATALLGHQALVAAGKPGYVDRTGALVDGGYAACVAAGQALL
ncbi:MAG: PHP domain-containing protein [Planctomycetota bacterium]|nr:PHP domain-containing protein [Planctomycetota bacterium]